MYTIVNARHAFPERAGLCIDRPNGRSDYTFIHFWSAVEIRQGEALCRTAPHACILYRRGTPQYYRCSTPLIHDWLHFTGEIDELLEECGVPLDRVFYPSRTEPLTALTRELESELYGNRPGRERLLSLKLEELCILLGRYVSAPPLSVEPAAAAAIGALRERAFSSLAHPWTAEEMAAAVHLSPSHFFALYKTLWGNSPIADLIRARIDAARTRLAGTDAPVARIAEELGYANLTHFSRQFRAMTGISPAAFRRAGRG